MKYKIKLHYATEKEARFYLRHLNYGFISTVNRNGDPILVENVPQMPREALDNIGLFEKVTMPGEKYQFNASSDNNNDYFLLNNPPAMPLIRTRENDRQNVRFTTSTTSGILCNIRPEPYNINQRRNLLTVNLAAPCPNPNPIPNQSQLVAPRPSSNPPPLVPIPRNVPRFLLPEFPLTSTGVTAGAGAGASSASVPTFRDEPRAAACALPTSEPEIAQELYTPPNSQLLAAGLPSSSCELKKKVTYYVGLSKPSPNMVLSRFTRYNDPEISFERTERMSEIDALLAGVHMSQNYSGPNAIISDLDSRTFTVFAEDQFPLAFVPLEIENSFYGQANLPLERRNYNRPASNTFSLQTSDAEILNRRRPFLLADFYTISSMDYSKIIYDGRFIHYGQFLTHYWQDPEQGEKDGSNLIWYMFQVDLSHKNTVKQKNRYSTVFAMHEIYNNTVDMNFKVDSNFAATPIQTKELDLYFKHFTAPQVDSFASYVAELEFLVNVISRYYEYIVQRQGDLLEMHPKEVADKFTGYQELVDAAAGTIFEGLPMEIFSHLFEILKYDVHRIVGIPTLIESLSPPPLRTSELFFHNPEMFGVFKAVFVEHITTIAVLFSSAVSQFFQGQPAPVPAAHTYIRPLKISKQEFDVGYMQKYLELVQRYPRGKLFDTAGTFMTNCVSYDHSNTYFWEIVGNYAYVVNTSLPATRLYTDQNDDLGVAEGVHNAKRPFPLNYILGRPVINVYVANVSFAGRLYQALVAFLNENLNLPLIDQIANGESWSEMHRALYNKRAINLTVVQNQTTTFQPVGQTFYVAKR